jgi:hypothetical protein
VRFSVAPIAAALLLPLLSVHAQERGGLPSYKVEFNIRDGSDPAAKAGRHYMLLMDPGHKAVFKVGNRVPVASGSFQPSTGGTGINPLTQYTYLDIGVNIECTVSEMNGRVAMHGNLDLSTMMEHDAASHAANPPNPTIVQTKLELDTAIEPGKPTVIAALDDPVNTRQFQVEATVTRVN